MIGKVKVFRSGGYDPNIPRELDTISDVVLAYRPPEKAKATNYTHVYNSHSLRVGRSVAIGGEGFMKPPPELDRIADLVLNYRPKPKTKAAKRRAKRKRQRDAKKG